jgi:hypothetical protein
MKARLKSDMKYLLQGIFINTSPYRPSEEIMKEIRELEKSILEKLKKVMGE